MLEDESASSYMIGSDADCVERVSKGHQVLCLTLIPAQEAHFGAGGLFRDLMEEDVLGGEGTGRASAHAVLPFQCISISDIA